MVENLDLIWLRMETVAKLCEHGNKPLVFVKSKGSIEHVKDYQLRGFRYS
jgi:hypothetical protein